MSTFCPVQHAPFIMTLLSDLDLDMIQTYMHIAPE